MNFLLTRRKIKFSSLIMRKSKKRTLMLMVRNAITIIHLGITTTIITITKNNNRIMPSSKSQILSSSNQQLLLSIIITIILITIIHTFMIITTSHMITTHTKSMISISIMLIALTGILMKMKLKRKKKRKNVGMIIQPIIIIIIQRYRREISKANTIITMLTQKVLAKHSQQLSFKLKRTLNTKIQLNNS